MVTVDAVKQGVNRFVREYVLTSMTLGSRGRLLGGLAADILLNGYLERGEKMLEDAGMVRDGMVDVDAVLESLRENIGDGYTDKIGFLPEMTFHREDVDALGQFVRGER